MMTTIDTNRLDPMNPHRTLPAKIYGTPAYRTARAQLVIAREFVTEATTSDVPGDYTAACELRAWAANNYRAAVVAFCGY
jgi:hypothetical protein